MKFLSLVLGLFFLVTGQIQAQDNPFISKYNPRLNAQQWKAIELADKWVNGYVMPAAGENGKVIFPYGTSMPFVISMPLYPSEIVFEPGEVIKDFHIGDSARWKITPAVSGPESNQVHRIIIKPVDSGLKTALIVNTDRRSYYIHLISRQKNLMPKVGFSYPENNRKMWNSYFEQYKARIADQTIPETNEHITDLSFEYDISGRAPFKPLRVYNDGVQTIIQLPKNINSKEAPSLLVLAHGNKKRIVNYRFKNDRYIVDEIFDKAILIAGVGGHQQKITITRKDG